MSVPTLGNISLLMDITFGESTTWSEVAANTTAEQTVTIRGLKTTDHVYGVSKPTEQAGLSVRNLRVSAADTLSVQFANNTGAGITPTALEAYSALVGRPERKRTDAVG
jgi:hypothetical protein